jgi:hypothetical protein
MLAKQRRRVDDDHSRLERAADEPGGKEKGSASAHKSTSAGKTHFFSLACSSRLITSSRTLNSSSISLFVSGEFQLSLCDGRAGSR